MPFPCLMQPTYVDGHKPVKMQSEQKTILKERLFMKNVTEMNYREVQAMAKSYGIKANQKKDVLVELILAKQENKEEAQDMFNEPVEQNVEQSVEQSVEEEFESMFRDDEDEEDIVWTTDENIEDVDRRYEEYKEEKKRESASEASAPVDVEPFTQPAYTKLFEFVRADNCIVHFRQKGVDIKIGWSKKDFKCHMVKDGKAKFYHPQNAINAFKKFVDGKHGDIKRIVHALVRLKQKPGIIKSMEQNAIAQQRENVSRAAGKENQSTTNRRPKSSSVIIDPQWLASYKEEQGDRYDARNVREAYNRYLGIE